MNVLESEAIEATGGAAVVRSVVNAASGRGGRICPGQMVRVAWDEDAAPSRLPALPVICFNGTPVRVVARGEREADVVVPYRLPVHSIASVTVEYPGRPVGEALRVPVAPASPGLFTAAATTGAAGRGSGAARAVNQTLRANGENERAAAGSLITLYGTGEGLTDPAGDDRAIAPAEAWRLPRPVLPVEVRIGGVVAPLVYAGAIAREPAGMFQMLVEVPGGLAAGNHEVVVSVGGFSSQPGVTLWTS